MFMDHRSDLSTNHRPEEPKTQTFAIQTTIQTSETQIIILMFDLKLKVDWQIVNITNRHLLKNMKKTKIIKAG